MNLGYFMMAPTLCYQLNYPRSPGPIRFRYILTLIVRISVMSAFAGFIVVGSAS